MAINVRAGKLRHRVTAQRIRLTDDGGGGHTEEWIDQSTFWASIRPVTGREDFQGDQIQDEVTHEIRFRAPRDILPRDRIKFCNRVFNVVYVLDIDEMGHHLKALCEEGVPT